MNFSRLLIAVALAWYHSALVISIAFFQLAMWAERHPAMKRRMDVLAEGVFLFLAGGLVANAICVLVLIWRGRKVHKWGMIAQLVVGCLASLPIYGPFYYAKQARELSRSSAGDKAD